MLFAVGPWALLCAAPGQFVWVELPVRALFWVVSFVWVPATDPGDILWLRQRPVFSVVQPDVPGVLPVRRV